MVDIQQNVSLAQYTTYRVGGGAKFFCVVRNEQEIIEAVEAARKNNWPFFILGSGSNLLVSDSGFDGLVIKLQNALFKPADELVTVGAGLTLDQLIKKTTALSLSGLEWAIGIPGTVGGGVCGNCGALGHSLSESIEAIRALDTKNMTIKNYAPEQCQFAYRHSIFKQNSDIILEAVFKLSKGSLSVIKKTVEQHIALRKKNPPHPSAGSVFKNIETKHIDQDILKQIPEDKIKGGKIPAGYLIEQCGLKGKEFGGAKIANEHANFIINFTSVAKANDIMALIDLCKQEVNKKFGIELEEEIKRIEF